MDRLQILNLFSDIEKESMVYVKYPNYIHAHCFIRSSVISFYRRALQLGCTTTMWGNTLIVYY